MPSIDPIRALYGNPFHPRSINNHISISDEEVEGPGGFCISSTMRAGAFTLAVLVVCLHLSATGAKKRAHKAAHAHHADAKKAHKGVGGMMKFKMAEGVPAPGSVASTQPLAAVGDAALRRVHKVLKLKP